MRKEILLSATWMILIASGWASAAAQTVEDRPWSEILLVVDHKIALSLSDGAYVQGEALAVEPDNLKMKINKTSNLALHPQGDATISRSLISVIEVRTTRTRGFPVATQVIGSAASMGGLLGFGLAGGYGGLVASVGARVGGAAVGAIIGRKLDQEEQVRLIRVVDVPEGPADPGDPLAEAAWPRAEMSLRRRASAIALTQKRWSPAGESFQSVRTQDGSATRSGKTLIPRGPRKEEIVEDTWPVIPSRSRADWAF